MQTNFNIFNTVNKQNQHLTRKPEELPIHVIVPSENPKDLALGSHDVLVGVVNQHSSGHPHRERFHASTPFKKVFKEGERPQNDIVFTNIKPDPKVEPWLMESNHLQNLRFYDVYEDGSTRHALPSDDRLHLEKKRMEEDAIVGDAAKLIQIAYTEGNSEDRTKAANIVVQLQRSLNINNPELSQYLGQVLSTYQNNAMIKTRKVTKGKVKLPEPEVAVETESPVEEAKVEKIKKKKVQKGVVVSKRDIPVVDELKKMTVDQLRGFIRSTKKGFKGAKKKSDLIARLVEISKDFGKSDLIARLVEISKDFGKKV
jgi:hypothetical protein